jgi:hypothetical protein
MVASAHRGTDPFEMDETWKRDRHAGAVYTLDRTEAVMRSNKSD